eukprot:TRINITY_DN774233_c0_g1_i1.p1 TRINITY_DN774233_c0_g1~~TRINITY_DN774233_c0_g1_i1.p1  ORF type:complete len:225 (+),score=59.36 TRINITY_DN774233_c0_g1_i1:60-734(+)
MSEAVSVKSTPSTSINKKAKVIVVLEGAPLEVVKTKKGFELLNCDDHLNLHKRLHKDPAKSRPDISHQCLLALMDSPLNKAGLLQVFLRTDKNVLIEIDPSTRIPRTFKRYAGLMVQLLHKMKIRSAQDNKTLLKVIKGPVTRHFPAGARKFGTSVTGKLVNADELVGALPEDEPVVFCFGTMAHGCIKCEWIEELIGLSEYPLSGACAIGRLMNAFERKYDIV